MSREFTDEQISEAIAKAIGERDFEAVPGLIKLLALQNPSLAQEVYDLITKGEMKVSIR